VGKEHNKASEKLYCATANRHLVLSAKRTGTQKRTKIFHDICIVHTAVGEKARFEMKQHQPMKKSGHI